MQEISTTRVVINRKAVGEHPGKGALLRSPRSYGFDARDGPGAEVQKKRAPMDTAETERATGSIQGYFGGLSRNTFLLAAASLFADISTEMLYPACQCF